MICSFLKMLFCFSLKSEVADSNRYHSKHLPDKCFPPDIWRYWLLTIGGSGRS